MKKILDLTNYLETDNITERTIYTYLVRLDKETILNTLLSDFIVIKGNHFNIPERKLLECLLNKQYGETELHLEKI